MIIWWVLLWILLVIAVLLAALLLVPFNFSVRAGLDEEVASFAGGLSWAGGLAGLRAVASGGQPAQVSLRLGRWIRQPGRDKTGGQRQQRCQPPGRSDLAWTRTARPYLDKQVLKELFRYLLRLERSLDLRLSFEGEVGFGDPGLTGYLAGALAVLNTGRWKCNLQPNFTEEVLRFQGSLQGRVILARLLWLTGGLLLTAPVRSIWWRQWKTRKPKKRGQPKEAVVQ